MSSDDAGGTEDTLAASGGVAVDTARGRDRAELPRGAIVGRYVVLSKLGAGGMGVVYAAYDPELDRKVALKLLLPSIDAEGESGAGSSEGRTRLLREAQALAKLSHPNVVAIHDVGTVGERVWLAMEFVDGKTLGAWMKENRGGWRETLDVMKRAGRGLSAAHAAGLLHRDFKPDNVMIGSDGRVRVMDFGLARIGDPSPSGAIESDTKAAPELAALAVRVTQAGALMGTPAYMSPEHFRGEEATPAADQFAFCVTVWEALYGERPFRGETLVNLAASVIAGSVREPPRAVRVPRWLRRTLLRGLAVEPEKRWPSVDALLSALGRGHARARMRIAGAGVVVAGAALAAAFGYTRWDQAQRIELCEAEGASISETWNEDARGRLREGLLATGATYAPTTVEKVMPWLDDQAEAWREHRTQACLNANVDRTWDAATLDRSVWCLDERRLELESLVAELSRADAQVVQKAVTAAAGLTQVSPCLDGVVLERLPAPPAGESRTAIAEVRAELARAGSSQAAGRYPEGLEIVRAARERAEALDWPPLSAAARQREGALLDRSGSYADSEAASTAAYMEAAKASAWEVAADAATTLVYVVGYRQARHAEGKTWAGHAAVAVSFAGDPLGLREARRVNHLAHVQYAAGAYADAMALYEQALAIREKTLGPEHPDVAASLNGAAAVHDAMGAYADATALHERALAIREHALGPEHLDVAASLNNLGNAHYSTGAYAQAKAAFERAQAIKENALGREHPDVALGLNNLANVSYATGAYDEARMLYERALVIREKVFGAAHPDVATTLNNLGLVHYATGAYADAKALHQRALAIEEQALGPDHPEVAASVGNLANTHLAMGAYDEARVLHERALAMKEKALGPDHPAVATSLNNLGNVHKAKGEYADAKARYERALAIREKTLGPDHPDVASTLGNLGAIHLALRHPEQALIVLDRAIRIYAAQERVQEGELFARFARAKALLATRGDRARALAEAQKARDGFRELGEGQAKALAEVEAWLEATARPR